MTYTGPTLATLLIVLAFAGVYLWYLLRTTARGRLELYDFFMLSAVAAVPTVFVLLPDWVQALAELAGVGMPFFILDGILFVIAYYFFVRLAILVHKERKTNRLLVQEVAMLRADLDAHIKRTQGRP